MSWINNFAGVPQSVVEVFRDGDMELAVAMLEAIKRNFAIRQIGILRDGADYLIISNVEVPGLRMFCAGFAEGLSVGRTSLSANIR